MVHKTKAHQIQLFMTIIIQKENIIGNRIKNVHMNTVLKLTQYLSRRTQA